MKNPIILLVLGIVLIAGSLTYELVLKPDETQQAQVATIDDTPPAIATKKAETKRDILTYVPADTLLFFGGLEAGRFQDLLKISMPEQQGWFDEFNWDELNTTDEGKSTPAGGRMLLGMLSEFMTAFKTPETAAQTLGMKEEFDSAIYTVGAIPVMRITLADAIQFNSFLDKAELKSQVTHSPEFIDELKLRVYPLDNKPNNKSPELVIASQNNYAVISFAIPEDNRIDLLKQALGTVKPTSSLADNNTLKQIKDQYALHPAYIGYIDHLQIIKGLTNPESNHFGRMVDGFIKTAIEKTADMEAPTEHPLATIQTPACQTELVEFVGNWPRSIMGYTQIDVANSPMTLQALGTIEINDAELVSDLKTLRGYVPPHLLSAKHRPLAGLGLGFNMDALLPFLTKTYQNIIQTPYECVPLKDMKQELAASNGTAALGMVSGMLAGLQGMSATVFSLDGDIDFANKQPNIKSVDAMVTISANNPQGFLMMVQNFVPPLAGLQIPTDGSAIDLPVPLPIPMEEGIKLAIKGQHIVAYLGQRGKTEADKLASAALEKNSILAINLDHGQYMKMMVSAAAQADATVEGQDKAPDIEALTDAMASMDIQMNQTIDFNDNGITATATTVIH